MNTAINRTSLALVAAALITAAACTSPSTEAPPADAPLRPRDSALLRDFGPDAQFVLTDVALRRRLLPPQPNDGEPRGTGERPRGGTELYASTAPAVVMVRVADGHGSGFLVSPDGTIVTNHHVVETGLRHRADASYAMVHVGQLGKDGVMRLEGPPATAVLHKVDPVNDLAVLKLQSAAGTPPLPHLKLAAAAPKPGLDCAIVGHPASGMLWTYRPCQVASIGDFPKDMVDLVLTRLSATGQERAQIEAFVKTRPARLIMLTSAQANPGDSGGPVVDKDGALIGVTFAGPGNSDEDKFTYHVHLNEVRKLLADVPATPMVLPPDPWSFGPRAKLEDLDRDGKPDVLIAGTEMPDGSRRIRPEVMLFDVDNDSPAALLGSQPNLFALINDRKWDFEFALDVRGSGYASFYDSDNDGRYDTIFATDEDAMTAKQMFSMGADGRWRYQQASGQPIVAGSHLKNAQLGRKLDTLSRSMK